MHEHAHKIGSDGTKHRDPVCGMTVDETASHRREHDGETTRRDHEATRGKRLSQHRTDTAGRSGHCSMLDPAHVVLIPGAASLPLSPFVPIRNSESATMIRRSPERKSTMPANP